MAVRCLTTALLQVISEYHHMLREVYGPELVLEPYVLSIDAFQQYQHSGEPTAYTLHYHLHTKHVWLHTIVSSLQAERAIDCVLLGPIPSSHFGFFARLTEGLLKKA